MLRSAALLAALLAGCKDKDDDPAGDEEEGWRPDLVCPGDEGCESLGDGVLHAGAAALSITPTCFESWEDLDGNGEYDKSEEAFFDCGCDRLCPETEGYPGADDGEEDGEFQAIYIAGFGNNRPATAVRDDLWARAVAFRQGDFTVAVVSVDLVGVFYNEVVAIREEAAAAGIDVDHIVLSSTHNHEGPDTLGQWGKQIGESGYNPEYMAYVRAQAVQAVGDAVAGLQPATISMSAADVSTYDDAKGTRNVVYDHRDPKIIDRFIGIAHVTASGDGSTIATVVNFGNHPEALSSENTRISSDYVHRTREGVESGVAYEGYEVPGVGGVCVYLSAAVGGMMSPLRVEVTDGSGNSYSEGGFEKADAVGNVMAELVLGAIPGGEPLDQPQLALRTMTFHLPVDNVAFQAAFLLDMFNRPIYGIDTADPVIDDDERPTLLTEIDVLDIGPLRMLTVPGELLPELAIGGYDDPEQPYTPLEPIIESGNPNPPDLSTAPAGPYLHEQMGATYNWIVGLGNDEVGYIIPPYNFQLHDSTPYLQEADGHHYEETNSLGPETAPLLQDAITQLLEWSP